MYRRQSRQDKPDKATNPTGQQTASGDKPYMATNLVCDNNYKATNPMYATNTISRKKLICDKCLKL